MVHIATVTPPSLASDALSSFDKEVKQYFTMCSSMLPTTPGQAQLGPKFGGLGLRSLSHHVAAAFIASLSFSGVGSADNIHLQQAVAVFNTHAGLPLQYHLGQFCSGLFHSPEGLVRNDPSTTVPHVVGVFLPCQQSSPPVSGSSSCFLTAISGSFLWFGVAPRVE